MPESLLDSGRALSIHIFDLSMNISGGDANALDPISSAIVEDLIFSLRQRHTLLIVTHNLAQAKRIADRVALFWVQDGVGQLIESGKVEQIFDAPQHPLTAAYVTGARGQIYHRALNRI